VLVVAEVQVVGRVGCSGGGGEDDGRGAHRVIVVLLPLHPFPNPLSAQSINISMDRLFA
jgi:hypothetical protein